MKQLYLFASEKNDSPTIHPKETMHWRIFIDGAARNNPGPAGAGVVIYKNNKIYEKHGFYLAKKTNNQAEYLALLVALFYIKKHSRPHDHIDIISDSLLLVKQFKGEYRVKHPELKPLHMLAQKLLSGMIFSFAHVLREKNEEADALANSGIDDKVKLPSEFITLLQQHDIVL